MEHGKLMEIAEEAFAEANKWGDRLFPDLSPKDEGRVAMEAAFITGWCAARGVSDSDPTAALDALKRRRG